MGIEGKEALRQQRHADAEKMRSSIAHIEARDKHLKLASMSQKKEMHQAVYGSQFVDTTAAAKVERSAYTTVSNAHRLAESSAPPSPALGPVQPGTPGKASSKKTARAAWASYFGNLTATSSRTHAKDGQFGGPLVRV